MEEAVGLGTCSAPATADDRVIPKVKTAHANSVRTEERGGVGGAEPPHH